LVPNPGNPQDLNRYAYVRNNPLRYVDPSGYTGVGYDPGAYLPWEWWEEPPPPSDSWDKLPQEERLLAARAYLDYLENRDYYRSLYLDPTSDPGLLAPLLVWAEYREPTSLVLLLEVDLWEEGMERLKEARLLEDSGEIGVGEYWGMVSGTMFVMGLMETVEGVGSGGPAPTWPSTPEEMDDLLGFEGRRIPDTQNTPGRNKVVWNLSDDLRVTYEQHPYHPTAPDWHRGPHWHLDTPGKLHQRYLPGDVIPRIK
jgi:hypothetical protein